MGYITLSIVDAKTRNPIAGALITSNGVAAGSSGQDGTLLIPVMPTSTSNYPPLLLRGSKSGYSSSSVTLSGPADYASTYHELSLAPVPTSETWQLTVTDSGSPTAAPQGLNGAATFIDGIQWGITANGGKSGGTLDPSVAHQVTISLTGYQSSSFTVNAGATPPASIALQPLPSTARQVMIIVNPLTPTSSQGYAPTFQAQLAITDAAGNSLATGAADTNGNWLTGESLPDGTYALTITAATFNTYQGSLTLIGGINDYPVTLTVSDPGQLPPATSVQASALQAASTAASSTPLVSVASMDISQLDPEYIPSDYGFQRYYTSKQAQLYLNNIFIDEFNSVQWVLQQNSIPVYGYCSSKFDDVGIGKSLIQGQLTLNFISAGYLLAVLAAKPSNNAAESENQYQQLLQEQALLTGAMLSGASSDLMLPSSTQAYNNRLAQIAQQKTTLAQQLGPAGIARVSSSMQRFRLQSTASPGNGFNNAVYPRGPFTLDLELTSGGTPQRRRLSKLYLISNEVLLDQSDQPILDAYGFIAREAR